MSHGPPTATTKNAARKMAAATADVRQRQTAVIENVERESPGSRCCMTSRQNQQTIKGPWEDERRTPSRLQTLGARAKAKIEKRMNAKTCALVCRREARTTEPLSVDVRDRELVKLIAKGRVRLVQGTRSEDLDVTSSPQIAPSGNRPGSVRAGAERPRWARWSRSWSQR